MLSWLFDLGMAVAPVTGYVLQYRLILLNKSVGAFSPDICLVLLFANITRLNFYIFRQYEIALFFQSLFMITAQLLLLRACAKYYQAPLKQLSEDKLTPQAGLPSGEGEGFWRWSSFETYVRHVVWFSVGTLILSLIMKVLGVAAYGDLVGLVALLSESVLILPQIIQIFKQGRASGISHHLLFANLLGDIIKMYYFLLKDQPFQFKLCGGIQLVLDSFVILQVWRYSRGEQLQQEEVKDKGIQDNKELQGSMSHTVVIEENLQQVEAQSDSTRTTQ